MKRLFDRPADGFRPLGVLADFVEVTNPEWERASEEFLHEELEYVVVQDWQGAERGIEVLRAASDGRATFLVHPESSAIVRRRTRSLVRSCRLRHFARRPSPDQRFRGRPARPPAAPGPLLPGIGSLRRPAPGRVASRLLFPAARRRQLSRPHHHAAARKVPAARWPSSANCAKLTAPSGNPRPRSRRAHLRTRRPGARSAPSCPKNWNKSAPNNRPRKRTR